MHWICVAKVFSTCDIGKLRDFFLTNYPGKEKLVHTLNDEEKRQVKNEKMLFCLGKEKEREVELYVGKFEKNLFDSFKELSKSLKGILMISITDSNESFDDDYHVFFAGSYVGGWFDDVRVYDDEAAHQLDSLERLRLDIDEGNWAHMLPSRFLEIATIALGKECALKTLLTNEEAVKVLLAMKDDTTRWLANTEPYTGGYGSDSEALHSIEVLLAEKTKHLLPRRDVRPQTPGEK